MSYFSRVTRTAPEFFYMKSISLKDIAKLANVAPSTVSQVLNGKVKEARISEKLASKIRAISKKAGYHPNHTAVSLRTGKSKIIGLIVEDISNPFFAAIAKSLEEEVYKRGYRIFYGSSENNDKKGSDLVKMLHLSKVDGLLIVPSEGLRKAIVAVAEAGTPVVFVDRYFPDLAIDAALVDNTKGVEKSVSHLIRSGYRNVGFVTPDLDLQPMQQREEGYRNGLNVAGIEVYEKNILRVPFNTSHEERVKKITRFFKSNDTIDAVIFATNFLGIAGLESIKDCGLAIPGDMAVICFDDHDLFRLYTPAITCIAQPIKEIAQRSSELLFDLLQGVSSGGSRRHELLEPKLVLRSST